MASQTTLFGEEIDLENKELIKNEYCCEACMNAEEERCTCRCGGLFHGISKKKRGDEEDSDLEDEEGGEELEVEYSKDVASDQMKEAGEPKNWPLTLGQWRKEVKVSKCPDCGGRLGALEHYDHDGGWTVLGFKEKQWLYLRCAKCGYEWAIWKLGVKRE